MNWNNKKEVLEKVKEFGFALEHASKELQNDKEVVLVAVKKYGWALEYASEELQNDKEVVIVAVGNDGLALEHASKELQNDKEVVLVAVKKYGRALRFASEELKNDKEVVIVAVNDWKRALEFASEELQNDKDCLASNVKKLLAKKLYDYLKDVDYYNFQDNSKTEKESIKDIEDDLVTLKGTKNIINYIKELEDNNKEIITLIENHQQALKRAKPSKENKMTRQEIKDIIKSNHIKLLRRDNEKMLKNYLEFCELKKIKPSHGTSLTLFIKGGKKAC